MLTRNTSASNNCISVNNKRDSARRDDTFQASKRAETLITTGFYKSHLSKIVEVLNTDVTVYDCRMRPTRRNILLRYGGTQTLAVIPASQFIAVMSNNKPRYKFIGKELNTKEGE